MLGGVMLAQTRPEEAVSVRLTIPVNPFRAVTVIVAIADVPMVTGAEEIDEIPKSATANATIVE